MGTLLRFISRYPFRARILAVCALLLATLVIVFPGDDPRRTRETVETQGRRGSAAGTTTAAQVADTTVSLVLSGDSAPDVLHTRPDTTSTSSRPRGSGDSLPLERVLHQGVEAVRAYLTAYPENLRGIYRGGTVAFVPGFTIGNDRSVDFAVVGLVNGATFIAFIIAGPAAAAPFTPAGEPAPELEQMLRRAEAWNVAVQDHRFAVGRDLARQIRVKASTRNDSVPSESLDRIEQVAQALEGLRFRHQVVLFAGRRSMYTSLQDEARRVLVESRRGIEIWTYDQLLEQSH